MPEFFLGRIIQNRLPKRSCLSASAGIWGGYGRNLFQFVAKSALTAAGINVAAADIETESIQHGATHYFGDQTRG
jgi:hypothetical protein